MSISISMANGYGVKIKREMLDLDKIERIIKECENPEYYSCYTQDDCLSDFRCELGSLDLEEKYLGIVEIRDCIYVLYEPSLPWEMSDEERNIDSSYIHKLIHITIQKFCKEECDLRWVTNEAYLHNVASVE